MDDIDEIRRQNLRAESKRLGGDTELAAALDVDKNQVWQWIRTRDLVQQRTMLKKTARKLEKALGRSQGWLDRHQAADSQSATPPGRESPDPGNDVKALRFALQSLCSVVHGTRPDIALAVAQDLILRAGTSFVAEGFLANLVATLLGADEMSEAQLREFLKAPASQASTRVAPVAK